LLLSIKVHKGIFLPQWCIYYVLEETRNLGLTRQVSKLKKLKRIFQCKRRVFKTSCKLWRRAVNWLTTCPLRTETEQCYLPCPYPTRTPWPAGNCKGIQPWTKWEETGGSTAGAVWAEWSGNREGRETRNEERKCETVRCDGGRCNYC